MNPSPGNSEVHPFHPPSQADYSSSAAATAAAALSQHHAPTSNANTPTHGRKRKASGVPGSRGVANLTPDQLAKKRANDREAQRAIRERTKNTIETLERRIKELETGQPFQEIQRLALERDRALAECEQLRNKLAVVQSVVGGGHPPSHQSQPAQPNLHGTFDVVVDRSPDPAWLTESNAELATLTAQQSPLPPLNTPQTPHFPHSVSASPYEQQQQQLLHPELRSPHTSTRPSSAGQSHSSTPGGPHETRLDTAASSHYSGLTGAPYEPRLPPPAAMLGQMNGERHGLNYVLGPRQQHMVTSAPTSQSPQSNPSPGMEKPLYARVPANSSPVLPLDALLLGFLNDRRAQLASGTPLSEVIGPFYPTLDGLRDPGSASTISAHPISALLTDILFKFPGIDGLPERVGVHYLMFLILRWQICPCESCYERLPSWIQPVREQLDNPHPAWVDHLCWPFMRVRMCTTASHIRFEDLFIPFSGTISVNWPYPPDHVLMPSSTKRDALGAPISEMNPVFESHVMDLRNWSVGSIFKATYPELVDESVRVQDRAVSSV